MVNAPVLGLYAVVEPAANEGLYPLIGDLPTLTLIIPFCALTPLVVELKKGRVSDNVVGQIQRYMGFVKEELAEKDQDVKGIIIGFDDDVRLQRALSVTNNIEFYKYEVNFKLIKN